MALHVDNQGYGDVVPVKLASWLAGRIQRVEQLLGAIVTRQSDPAHPRLLNQLRLCGMVEETG